MSSESPIYDAAGDDPRLIEAAAMARKTFKFLWRELAWERRRIIPALDLATVKAAFSDPGDSDSMITGGYEVEQMWLMDVDFDGQEIKGTLINTPHSLKSIKEGDEVSLYPKQLTDWIYAQQGVVYGGFGVDVLRSQMDSSERSQHDDAWGLDFGKVGMVDVVPPEYLGDKPRKQGFFASLFGSSNNDPQDYQKAAQIEHPMSESMGESLREHLTNDPSKLEGTDHNGLNILHQLALAGSLKGVDVCMDLGADPNKPASNGLTAIDLAKFLGWNKVVQRLLQG